MTVEDFEKAVADAHEAFSVECAEEDTRQTLLRLQHFASSAGAALLEGNAKLYISCLVSNAALSQVLLSRLLPEDNDVDDEDVAGTLARRS